MPIKNETQAIELIIGRLPHDDNALIELRPDDVRYIPSAVRRYVKRRAKRWATTMNGEVNQHLHFIETKAELTRLNMLAIDRCLHFVDLECPA